jgi:hypothetical protein
VFRDRPVSLVLVGLFVWVTACTSYKQIEVGEIADHGKVRVTFTDGECETLRDPWIDGDSIKAYLGNLGPQQRVEEIVAIPLEDVAELGAVGTNEVGIVLIGLGVVALALGVACATSCEIGGSW